MDVEDWNISQKIPSMYVPFTWCIFPESGFIFTIAVVIRWGPELRWITSNDLIKENPTQIHLASKI